MLKGFLIFIFVLSAVALISIQVTKSPPEAQQSPKISNNDDNQNMDNLVFHALVRPEDKSKQKNQPSKSISNLSSSCSTDLECETTLKVSPLKFDSEVQPTTNKTVLQDKSVDSLEEIINTVDESSQKKEDEIFDLIDNLADLQERIEKNQ